MVSMRKSRLSKVKQDRLIEYFVAGTTARCAAALIRDIWEASPFYGYRKIAEILRRGGMSRRQLQRGRSVCPKSSRL